MTCAICMKNKAGIGVLCEACRDELLGAVAITPEQIVARDAGVTVAALIDQWGRVNRVGSDMPIGRVVDTAGLEILHGSVSRKHARIWFEDGGWRLRDMGSVNGTTMNEQVIKGVSTLPDRAKLRFGPFGFFFVVDASRLPSSQRRTDAATVQPFPRGQTLDLGSDPRADRKDPFRTMSFVFQQPTGGGVGIVEIDGTPIHLTLAQFELVSILAEQMIADETTPRDTRGFVDAPTLLERLSLDSGQPGEDSIRQLVRRTRRVLASAGLHGLIESKQRQGYRLAVVPRIRRQK